MESIFQECLLKEYVDTAGLNFLVKLFGFPLCPTCILFVMGLDDD